MLFIQIACKARNPSSELARVKVAKSDVKTVLFQLDMPFISAAIVLLSVHTV